MAGSWFWLLNSTAIFLCVSLHFANGFAGVIPDCSGSKACSPHQKCVYGYCHCDQGFVELNYSCFKVRRHGEDCYFDEQCPDYRMSCTREDNSTLNVKYCLCDKYHPWDDDSSECIPALNIKIMIASLLEKYDLSKVIGGEADNVFYFIRISAFLVLAMGALFAAGCVAHGCCSCVWCVVQLSSSERDKCVTPLSPCQVLPSYCFR